MHIATLVEYHSTRSMHIIPLGEQRYYESKYGELARRADRQTVIRAARACRGTRLPQAVVARGAMNSPPPTLRRPCDLAIHQAAEQLLLCAQGLSHTTHKLLTVSQAHRIRLPQQTSICWIGRWQMEAIVVMTVIIFVGRVIPAETTLGGQVT